MYPLIIKIILVKTTSNNWYLVSDKSVLETTDILGDV